VLTGFIKSETCAFGIETKSLNLLDQLPAVPLVRFDKTCQHLCFEFWTNP
jgi:hypothetical protein